jgi:hypothetical protein
VPSSRAPAIVAGECSPRQLLTNAETVVVAKLPLGPQADHVLPRARPYEGFSSLEFSLARSRAPFDARSILRSAAPLVLVASAGLLSRPRVRVSTGLQATRESGLTSVERFDTSLACSTGHQGVSLAGGLTFLTQCGGGSRRGTVLHSQACQGEEALHSRGEHTETALRLFVRLSRPVQCERSFSCNQQCLAMVRVPDTVAPRGLRLHHRTPISVLFGSRRLPRIPRLTCGTARTEQGCGTSKKAHATVHVRLAAPVVMPARGLAPLEMHLFLHSGVVLLAAGVSDTWSEHLTSLGSRARGRASTTRNETWS